jgi:hypothetical protein
MLAASAASFARAAARGAVPVALAGGVAYTLAARGVANADKAGIIKPIK